MKHFINYFICFFKLEGTLDEETISKNLSNLGRVADGSKMAYLNLTLPGFNLTNVSSLAKFKELQVLELSYNNLSGILHLTNTIHLSIRYDDYLYL